MVDDRKSVAQKKMIQSLSGLLSDKISLKGFKLLYKYPMAFHHCLLWVLGFKSKQGSP